MQEYPVQSILQDPITKLFQNESERASVKHKTF